MTTPLVQRCFAISDQDDERTALSYKTLVLTRRDFRHAVAARMRELRGLNVTPGQRILIFLPKSPAAVELVFACLAMGAVAVPVDIRTPVMRLHDILSEITPSVLVTSEDLMFSLGALISCQLLCAGDSAPSDINEDLDTLFPAADNDLAMILMSSGSTGVPKGICISHGNLHTFVQWATRIFEFTHQDRFLSVAPLHFDLSTLDLFASQFVGAHVHLLDEQQVMFPAEILASLRQQSATVLYTVPTNLQMMFRAADQRFDDLRCLLFAGEAMPRSALPALFKAAPNAHLANLYGPTETNVVSCYNVQPNDGCENDLPLPIGVACSHSKVWICDAHGQEVPDGVEGEICVQGPTVTGGYWQRREMTVASRVAGQKDTYRTGDIGWRRADGTLYFTGRRDHRVKVRGILINLAEIEHVALASGKLSHAAAIVQNPETPRACVELFYAPKSGIDIDTKPLRDFLGDRLPRQWLPARMTQVDKFDQTLNGKTNRQTLVRMPRDGQTSKTLHD